jgi:hypothetical protein
LGYSLQVLSPTTRLFSRHQLTHLLQGRIAAAPSDTLIPSLPRPYFLFLSDAGFIHLNAKKIKKC